MPTHDREVIGIFCPHCDKNIDIEEIRERRVLGVEKQTVACIVCGASLPTLKHWHAGRAVCAKCFSVLTRGPAIEPEVPK